jgi:filamentous hemagglutinin family protein
MKSRSKRSIAVLLLLGFLSLRADAGVISDGSRGSVVSHAGSDFGLTGGTKVGGNLFHSYSEFNLLSGESATFSGPNDVTNILARVTGGSASNIDGTLRSTIPGANLFLMNPRGVVFGPNAKLDVSGSFAVTTADYLKLSDGGRFDASLGGQDSLTSAPVSAFGFLSATPAAVSFDRSQLSVQPGTGLHVIAGDVALRGSSLKAPSGSLTLFSAASAGEVPFDLASPGGSYSTVKLPALGSVSLADQSLMSIDGAGGGKVVIRGGKLTVDKSTISSANSGSTPGGAIDVQMDSDISLRNGSAIVSSAAASGQSGNVSVQSGGTLSVSGTLGAVDSSIQSRADAGTGNSGSVTVKASEIVLQDGFISAITSSAGNAGDVAVNAHNLTIVGSVNSDGLGAIGTNVTGITVAATSGSTGSAGVLQLTVDQLLSMTGSGLIVGFTFGSGNGGSLNVHAGSLTISDSSGIFVAADRGSTGNAGDLQLTVDHLISMTGGVIAGITTSSGKGGNLTVHAGTMTIDGALILAAADSGSTGNGGALQLTVDQTLSITGGGSIRGITSSSGAGGSLAVHAGNVTIDGYGSIAVSAGFDSTGKAGDLQLTVDQHLSISGGGEISGSTFASGDGGSLTVHAGSVTIDGSATPDGSTGIFVRSLGEPDSTGNAGDLQLTVDGTLSITGAGSILADTFSSGNGGNLTVHAGVLTIDGYATPDKFTGIAVSTSTGSTGNAGHLQLTVDQLLSISGKGTISGATFASGDGGSLTVHAGSLTIDGSATPDKFTGIAVSAGGGSTGNAGELQLAVDQLLAVIGGGQISATTHGSGEGGSLTVHSGSVTIDGGAVIRVSAEVGSTGNAGELQLTVDQLLSITGSGEISGLTRGSGAGGSLTVHAGSLTIDGAATPDKFTGIAVNAGTDSTGNAGDLQLAVDQLIFITGSGTITGATFGSGDGGSLTVHAGNLTIDGSTTGRSAGIEVSAGAGSTGNAGEIQLQVDQLLSIRVGEISGSTFGSGNGGSLTVHAGELIILNAGEIIATAYPGSTGNAGDLAVSVDGLLSMTVGGAISTDTFSSGNAGNLTVSVDGHLSITKAGTISAETLSSGNGGNLTIHAGTLTIDGSGTPLTTGINTDALERGNGGNATIVVDGALTILGTGEISASSLSEGNGGSLSVWAGTLTIDGSAKPKRFTGIITKSYRDGGGNAGDLSVVVNGALNLLGTGGISAATDSIGNGGDLSVTAPSVTITGGSAINADTNGAGRGGRVTLTTQNLVIDGLGSSKFTGISSDSTDAGQAGGVVVRSGDLRLVNGGQISTSAFGPGQGGDVNVVVDAALIRDRIESTPSGVFATSDGTGNAGKVLFQSRDLTMSAGGLISSSTSGQGNAGTVTVNSHRIDIDGQGDDIGTGIISNARPGSTGQAGDVRVESDSLTIKGGGEVAASTLSSGKGGDVTLQLGILVVDGIGTAFFTGVRASSEPGATGVAGSVTISASQVSLANAGQISVTASAASGGGITVSSESTITLSNGSSITASAAGDGGNIFISARDLFFLDHSSVVATAGTSRLAGARDGAAGAGGNISIDPTFIILDHGLISANAAIGAGGSIFLQAENFFTSESAITATGSTAGTVTIASPELDLSAALAALTAQFVDASVRLQERCTMRLGVETSSFLAIGRGGVEESPDEPQTEMETRVPQKGKGKARAR